MRSISFADIPTFEPVPAGNYPVMVENVTLRKNKEGKLDPDTGEVAEYFAWEFVIIDGEFQGQHLWLNTTLQRKGLFKLRNTFLNLGVIDSLDGGLDYDVDEATDQVIEPELINRTGVARVKMGKNQNGEARSEVDTILDNEGIDRERSMRDAARGGRAQAAPVTTNGAPAQGQRKMTLR